MLKRYHQYAHKQIGAAGHTLAEIMSYHRFKAVLIFLQTGQEPKEGENLNFKNHVNLITTYKLHQ